MAIAQILPFPSAEMRARRHPAALAPYDALLRAVALHRWPEDSVFWMKEMAEVLGIGQEVGLYVGAGIGEETAALLRRQLDALAARHAFFPQYYRFSLAIFVAAAGLGLWPQDRVAALAAEIAAEGWDQGELSDLHRAEAQYLFARAGLSAPKDAALEARLWAFASRPETFARPNRKAAYDLTHTLFYLSDHGQKPLILGENAKKSLKFAGTLAFLEQNADLLSEVALCMLYAGLTVPKAWHGLVADAARAFRPEAHWGGVEGDDGHCLWVCNWYLARTGASVFWGGVPALRPGQALHLWAGPARAGALGDLARVLWRPDGGADSAGRANLAARGDWDQARPALTARLSPEARAVLAEAEAALPDFSAFFEAFARPAGALPRRQTQS